MDQSDHASTKKREESNTGSGISICGRIGIKGVKKGVESGVLREHVHEEAINKGRREKIRAVKR